MPSKVQGKGGSDYGRATGGKLMGDAAAGHELPRVVFLVSIRAHFPELYRTAAAMSARQRLRPVLVFCGEDNYAEERRRCTSAGIESIDMLCGGRAGAETQERLVQPLAVHGSAPPADGVGYFRIRRGLKRLAAAVWVVRQVRRIFVNKTSLLSLPLHLLQLWKLREEAKNLLRTTRPDALVLPHIDMGRMSGCVAYQAKRHGISVLVLPYTWIFREEISKAICTREEYSACTFIGARIARRYPHWTYGACLFLPPSMILGLEWLGMSTSHPWMADQMADCIAVDSELMLESYVLDGVEKAKCRITGSASHDILAHALNESDRTGQILADLGLSSEQGRIPAFALSFLPPDQTGNQMAGFEYASYLDMLRFWIETVTEQSEIPVVFSLHPRMNAIREVLASEYPRIAIYAGDACELIPRAVFCIGQFGGMLRFAVACGKPVLYYDVFHYHMSRNQFLSLPSVVEVREKGAFAETVRRFAGDRIYRSGLERAARTVNGTWGVLDGHAVDRIETLILKNISQPNFPQISLRTS